MTLRPSPLLREPRSLISPGSGYFLDPEILKHPSEHRTSADFTCFRTQVALRCMMGWSAAKLEAYAHGLDDRLLELQAKDPQPDIDSVDMVDQFLADKVMRHRGKQRDLFARAMEAGIVDLRRRWLQLRDSEDRLLREILGPDGTKLRNVV